MTQDEIAAGGLPERAPCEEGTALASKGRRLLGFMVAVRAEWRTRRALRRLDDRMLEDIGVASPEDDRPQAATRPPGVGDAVLALVSEYGRAGRRARGVLKPDEDRRRA